MMGFDHTILHWLNTFAHRSPAFDTCLLTISENQFVKGLVVILFCWLWFRHESKELHRRVLVAGLFSPFVAFCVARISAHALPFRLRPIGDPALHLQPPYGVDPASAFARSWSSFPSDHAALFAAFAMTLMLVSRRAGLLAFIYTLVVIDFPRVYLGYHYPSDILGGMVVGIAVALAIGARPVRERVAPLPMRVLKQSPGLFYAGLFLVLFALGSVNSIHALLTFSLDALGSIHPPL